MKKFTYLLLTLSLLTSVLHAAVPLDFDGDGKTDIGIVRERTVGANALADYYILRSGNDSMLYQQWGFYTSPNVTDRPIWADYDGDGKTDFAVSRRYDPNVPNTVFILKSSNSTVQIENFGLRTDNVDVAGDYDGDGKADLAVYRRFGESMFIYKGSLNNPNGNLTYIRWGTVNLFPVNGDFDGDGKLDFCLTNQQGFFYLLRSSDFGVEYISWGLSADRFRTGDFDGDGKTDICAIRIGTQNELQWYVLERDGGGTGANPIIWGTSSNLADQPILGDYDGDNKTDIGVYRIAINQNSTFFIRKAMDGSMLAYQWGLTGDQALAGN